MFVKLKRIIGEQIAKEILDFLSEHDISFSS